MPKVDVYDINGKKVSDVELNEKIFGIEPNENIVHEVLVNYLANQRQGTQSTKTRAEVRGGGRKPWRQKGTGRARQGSIRAPQWIKGGIALGPKPRSYRYSINKKEKQLAIKSVLSSKVLESKLTVVDNLELAEIKTKSMDTQFTLASFVIIFIVGLVSAWQLGPFPFYTDMPIASGFFFALIGIFVGKLLFGRGD